MNKTILTKKEVRDILKYMKSHKDDNIVLFSDSDNSIGIQHFIISQNEWHKQDNTFNSNCIDITDYEAW